MKGFKVVKVRDDRFFSAALKENAELEYKTNKRTYAYIDCGPLAVFTNKPDAEKFAVDIKRLNKGLYTQVFPCVYEESKHTKLWLNTVLYIYRTNLPKGTAFATWVKIYA